MRMKFGLKLFALNVKKILKGGFHIPGDHLIGILMPVIHLVLLPVTLTFGALIKTVIEMNTREFPQDYEKDKIIEAVGVLDNNQFKALEQILQYATFQSIESRELKKNLYKIDAHATFQLKKFVDEEKFNLQLTQLGDNASEKYDEYDISNVILNKENLSLFDKNCLNKKYELEKEKQIKCKNAIASYLHVELNEGRRMHQLIVGFFAETQVDSDDQNNLFKYSMN